MAALAASASSSASASAKESDSKKISQVGNKQMDAEFDVGLLVQNSQSHPAFDFD